MTASPDPSVPAYNMKAVVEATGVRAETLRSWERRFHVLHPARTSSGYRKYSPQDLQTIRWLQRRLTEGFTIGRAVELLQAEGEQMALPPAVRTPAALASDLTAAFRRLDESAAERLLAEALALYPPEHLCLAVLTPSLVTLGDHGIADQGEMAPAHFASVLIRAKLLALYQWAGDAGRSGPLTVFAGAPGEPHDLGLLMVALFARRAGLRTLLLGPAVGAQVAAAVVQRWQPAVLCLSASAPSTAVAALDVARGLRHHLPGHGPIVLVGGSGFAELVSATEEAGAQHGGATAAEALQRLIALH